MDHRASRGITRVAAVVALVAAAGAFAWVVVGTLGEGGDGSGDEALVIPGENGEGAPGRAAYVVKPGDSLSAISERAGVPIEEILRLNPDVDPQTISPGTRLRLRE